MTTYNCFSDLGAEAVGGVFINNGRKSALCGHVDE